MHMKVVDNDHLHSSHLSSSRIFSCRSYEDTDWIPISGDTVKSIGGQQFRYWYERMKDYGRSRRGHAGLESTVHMIFGSDYIILDSIYHNCSDLCAV